MYIGVEHILLKLVIQVIEDMPYHSSKGIVSHVCMMLLMVRLSYIGTLLFCHFSRCTLILHIHDQFKTELVLYHITNLIFWIMILFQLYMYSD